MTLYRIYTEDTNREAVQQLATDRFDAYTLIPSRGSWKGTTEASLILEVVGNDDDTYLAVHALATDIKVLNHQDAVLITRTPITQTLV
jgi:hypothetical protein